MENAMQFGNSGTAFDQMELFTLDEAARALVFDRTGRYLPALPTALTPDGKAYHDWLNVLTAAAWSEGDDVLPISIYEEDETETWHIQRDDLKRWCEMRGMKPGFLFGKDPGEPGIRDDGESIGNADATTPAKKPPQPTARALATKKQILEAFPPPAGVTDENWEKTLGDPPAWLIDARGDSGGRGRASTWNPAMFALCLASEGKMEISPLTTIIKRNFPEWLTEWKSLAESLKLTGTDRR